MNDEMKQIVEQWLADAQAQLAQFVEQANRQIATLQGAIAAYEQLLAEEAAQHEAVNREA